jgi:hypothetical protein
LRLLTRSGIPADRRFWRTTFNAPPGKRMGNRRPRHRQRWFPRVQPDPRTHRFRARLRHRGSGGRRPLLVTDSTSSFHPLSAFFAAAASRGEHLEHWVLSSAALSLPLSLALGLVAGFAAIVMSQPIHAAVMLVVPGRRRIQLLFADHALGAGWVAWC